jgi:D-arabinose 1-dehydrogenase-like Zn-dependent alcohol dehydrogenase
VGSRALTRAEFREVEALVNSGQLDPDIGELIPIRRINEALDNLKNGRYPRAAFSPAVRPGG